MVANDLTPQPKKSNKWIFVVVGIAFFLVASWAIICIPQYQVRLLRERVEATQKVDPTQQIQLEKDYVDYANKARITLAQIIGGLLVLGTIGVALWNAKIAQDNARAAQQNAQAAQQNAETALKNLRLTEETAQKNLESARDSKITDRFSKAVEMLGSEKLEVCLGGIYALERIARDSPYDHLTVVEILIAFIRERTSSEPEYAEDPDDGSIYILGIGREVQAALTVIGRRKWVDQESSDQGFNLAGLTLAWAILSSATLNRVDFSGVWLSHADLRGATLNDANLRGAHLEGASLIQARLEGANLVGASLNQANLAEAHLTRANLWRANLEISTLEGAHLEKANLWGAKLHRANFRGANLKEAILYEADLQGAFFGEAHLENAGFKGAHLEGAHLKEAIGLTWEQVSTAIIDDMTELPPELQNKWNQVNKRREPSTSE